MIDRVKEFWDTRPCNVRHSLVDIEVDPLRYSQEVIVRKYFVEPHIPAFAQFSRWEGKTVLDVGCGIGTDAISFARAGARVTAIDISPRSIDIAYKRARVHGLDIEFVCGNIEKLHECVPSRCFDLVYSFGGLHHTPDPWAALRQIWAFYMSRNSVLKLMIYNRCSWKALWIVMKYGWGPWRETFDEAIARHSEAQEGGPVLYTFTRQTARDLLRGFKIEDIEVAHIFPWRVADYIEHRYVKEWYWRLMPDPLFRRLEKILGWHLLITARKLSFNAQNPVWAVATDGGIPLSDTKCAFQCSKPGLGGCNRQLWHNRLCCQQ